MIGNLPASTIELQKPSSSGRYLRLLDPQPAGISNSAGGSCSALDKAASLQDRRAGADL